MSNLKKRFLPSFFFFLKKVFHEIFAKRCGAGFSALAEQAQLKTYILYSSLKTSKPTYDPHGHWLWQGIYFYSVGNEMFKKTLTFLGNKKPTYDPHGLCVHHRPVPPSLGGVPHPAGAARVVGGISLPGREVVQLGVGVVLRPRLHLPGAEGGEGGLREDGTGQADRLAHLPAVDL